MPGSSKHGKRIPGVRFHQRFIEKLEHRIKLLKQELTAQPQEEAVIINSYIPCAEPNDENAKYLSGYIYIQYEPQNNVFVKRTLEDSMYISFKDVSYANMDIIRSRSRSNKVTEEQIKINDMVRINEEGDFFSFDGRVVKIDGEICEISVTLFNQDYIVRIPKAQVQKISENIESYSLKIMK